MQRVLVCAWLACALALPANAGQPAALKPLSFRAEARVDVDAQGKVVEVEAAQDLPETVRRYIERQLATWTYRRRDPGVAQGIATTWVDLRACAIPTPEGAYSMGLAYHGSGPMLTSMGRLDKLANTIGRYRLEGELLLHVVIGEDGVVSLQSIEGASEDRRDRAGMERFETVVKEWLGTLRVQQELIDGKP